jgi:hypothetical protein
MLLCRRCILSLIMQQTVGGEERYLYLQIRGLKLSHRETLLLWKCLNEETKKNTSIMKKIPLVCSICCWSDNLKLLI